MKPLHEFPELLHILKVYSPEGSDYAQQLLDMEAHSESSDMIVPVLGVQGAGKSTLINALLGEDILPSEADETTCVPVEIRYGEPLRAEVIMKDGSAAQTVNTKSELSQYVDNNFNPGNKLGVARIILYRTHPLLRTGLVIVDLPGVGSLTQANEDTTKSYIENLCVALFLIPTSPPILGENANFIKAAWRSFHTAYFVQNIWTDNSKQEVRDGLDTNQKILNDIAGQINAKMISEIIPVNAYNAAKGSCTHDEALIRSSNIGALMQALESFAGNYREKSAANFAARVRQFVQSVDGTLAQRISQCSMTAEQLAQQVAGQMEKLDKTSSDIHEKVRSIRKAARDARNELQEFAENAAAEYSKRLRAELFHLIDEGIVDGEQLRQAFTDYQTQYSDEAIDATYNKYIEVCEPIGKELEHLQDILQKESFSLPQMETFNKAQAFKWEKGMQAGIDLAGVLGGAAVGASVGGIVGFVVGGLIATVGMLIGGASRKAVTRSRGQQTKQELTPVLDRFQESLTRSLCEPFGKFESSLLEQLKQYEQARQNEVQSLQAELERLESEGAQALYDEGTLRRDQEFLKKWSVENNA